MITLKSAWKKSAALRLSVLQDRLPLRLPHPNRRLLRLPHPNRRLLLKRPRLPRPFRLKAATPMLAPMPGMIVRYEKKVGDAVKQATRY
jgi:biotin carboxyl carrier protein